MTNGGAWVTLTDWEMEEGARLGVARAMDAIKNNREDRYGCVSDPLGGIARHVQGAFGETATGKYTNLHLTGGVGTPNNIDVGNMIEVRSVEDMQRRLILHKKDKLLPFVLAMVTGRRVLLRGWIDCVDGRDEDHWETFTGRPAYFVPNEKLRPMDELLEVVHMMRFEQMLTGKRQHA